MPGSRPGSHSATRLVLAPHRWQLWALPPSTIAWMLLTELAAAAAVVLGTTHLSPPGPHDWLLFAALTACATLHLIWTRPAEERRRAADLKVEHIDQTSIWLFAGALVLPMPLLVGLVAVVRAQRYLIARKPPCRFLFSSAAILLSAAVAGLLGQVTPVGGWLTSTPPMPSTPGGLALVVGVLLAAMAAYFGVQTVVIGVARGLTERRWTLRAVAGSRADNVLLIQALCLGLLATLAVAFTVGLLVVVVPVAVHVTRTLQRIQQLEADQRRLAADAEHDPLTGLLNRRGFDPRAQLALVTGESAGRSTAVVMFDVDHFTGWNSRLGHLGADVLLTAITGCLSRSVRSTDLVGRWGGEEIALLLPDTTRAEAIAVVNRIRRRVADLRVEITSPAGGRSLTTNTDELPGCTISAGIAMAPEHGRDLHVLQEAADKAVYQAKRLGRNRVEVAPAVPDIPRQRSGDPVPQDQAPAATTRRGDRGSSPSHRR